MELKEIIKLAYKEIKLHIGRKGQLLRLEQIDYKDDLKAWYVLFSFYINQIQMFQIVKICDDNRIRAKEIPE